MSVKVQAGISKAASRPLSLAEKHSVTDIDRGILTDMFFPPLDSIPNIRKKKFKSVVCDYVSFFTATQSSEYLFG